MNRVGGKCDARKMDCGSKYDADDSKKKKTSFSATQKRRPRKMVSLSSCYRSRMFCRWIKDESAEKKPSTIQPFRIMKKTRRNKIRRFVTKEAYLKFIQV